MTALTLQDDIAALLQARMSWPAAEGCAADLIMMFARRMRDVPLTCQYCKHGPATHLLVADLEPRRTVSLVCEPCGNRSIGDVRAIAKAASSAWLFALVPAGTARRVRPAEIAPVETGQPWRSAAEAEWDGSR